MKSDLLGGDERVSVARAEAFGRPGASTPAELDLMWGYLRAAYHELRRRRVRFLRQLGLSWSEYLALQVCAHAPAMPSGIAETVGLTSAGATDVIDRLEQRRLVRRVPHPKDRRAVLVELTRSGERLYQKTQTAQKKVARTLSGALTRQEREALSTGLLAVLRALGEYAP